MQEPSFREIKLFYCYAHEDKPLRDKLEIHLGGLKRLYRLINWHDREILLGEEWEQVIDRHLNTADLILLLISPNFMNSDYCYSKEMHRALERHKEESCRVIPILLRPTYWKAAPFSHLQLLPTGAKPITSWKNRDKAFHDVVTEISRTIVDLLNKTGVERLDESNALDDFKLDEEALAAYDQAIRLDPNDTTSYNNKGDALINLKRYEEALIVLEQVIRLDPKFIEAYNNKGVALNSLERYEEALIVLEQVIRLDPDYPHAYNNKGFALVGLKQYEEALIVLEQAVRLDPNHAIAYNNKGDALIKLKRYEEALIALEQAIRLDPNYASAYNNKGVALDNLDRYEEALIAYDQAIRLDTKFTRAYINKGDLLRALGRRKEAQQTFARVRQISLNG